MVKRDYLEEIKKMNEQLYQTLQILFSFLILIGSLIFSLNWLQRGFLFTFIKVRGARGKKLLTEVHGANDVYYRVGQFIGTDYYYKNREGKQCLYANIDPSCVIQTMGVQKIEIDEINKSIWNREGTIFQGNDPVHVDQIVKRAMEGAGSENKVLKILIILFIIMLIVILVQMGFSYKIYQVLQNTNLAKIIV
jgi:hypothetical protein